MHFDLCPLDTVQVIFTSSIFVHTIFFVDQCQRAGKDRVTQLEIFFCNFDKVNAKKMNFGHF